MKLLYYPIILLMALMLAACGGDEPKPVQPAEPEADPVSRTVLVYMVADNSLGGWGLDREDIDEMTTAVRANGLNGGRLLVYWASKKSGESYPPRLLEITPEGEKVLKTYDTDGGVSSLDHSRIREVMADMKKLARAAGYGLVLWSHSNGWLGPSHPNDDRYRAFGEDGNVHITIPSLAKALEDERFEFVYFDCCSMGNIETLYELRHLAPVMVASPTELGVEGMPYDKNVPCFFVKTPNLELAARNTFESYDAQGAECQIAVYDMTQIDTFARDSREVLSHITRYPSTAGLQPFINGQKCYSYDMEDYFNTITSGMTDCGMEAWRYSLGNFVTYHAATDWAIDQLRINVFNGLGCFVPNSAADLEYRQYKDLAWWRDVVSHTPAFQE